MSTLPPNDSLRRILLIDDSPIALRSLRTVLSLHPAWEIVGEAASGPDGLALFQQKNPDVVIVDFQMPGMSGIEVGREIRKSRAKVLLILFTLHMGSELERMAAEAGFDTVLSKSAPYPIVAIIEKMRADRSSAEQMQDTVHATDGEKAGRRSR
jgi:DNA-binding NarL/FixJ family response regulator